MSQSAASELCIAETMDKASIQSAAKLHHEYAALANHACQLVNDWRQLA